MLAARLLLAALLAPAPASNQVWIVDAAGGPGADFTSLPAAFAGASDGDLLVFRAGSYETPTVLQTLDGKALHLVADGDVLVSSIEVRNLAPSQPMLVRGLKIGKGSLTFTSCTASVWVEELALDPIAGGTGASARLQLLQSTGVVLHRSMLQGFPSTGAFASTSVIAIQSELFVFDCVLTGGDGTSGPFATPGQPGLHLIDSTLFAEGTTFVPGFSCTDDALQVGASTSIALDCTGTFTVAGGTHATWPGTKRSFQASAVTREGQSASMRWTGAPGELAVLGLSFASTGLVLPQLSGSVLLGSPLILVTAKGVIPPSGVLDVAVPVPDLGAGVEGVAMFAQGGFVDAAVGAIRLGGGSAMVLLDQSL